jgi:hypothetical protein
MTTLNEIFDFGFTIFEHLAVRGLTGGGCASESARPEVSISAPLGGVVGSFLMERPGSSHRLRMARRS